MNKQQSIEFTLITDEFNSEIEQLQELLGVTALLASSVDSQAASEVCTGEQSQPPAWLLSYQGGRLSLSHRQQANLQNVAVDFNDESARFSSQAKVAHELLIKAVGGLAPPSRQIVDATAGLGTDSLLLALAGHRVTMLERSPVVAALLHNGLCRAPQLHGMLALKHGDAQNLLGLSKAANQPDIVYLDPMFPDSNKKALARKGLQALKQLLPKANSEEQLLDAALQAARRRVVVKRPIKAPPLAGQTPGFQYSGKLIRYDCYALAKL